jgi:hypothetical protein
MSGDLTESERWLREAAGKSDISTTALGIARLELGKTLDLRLQRYAAIEQYRRVLQTQDVLGLHQEADRWIRKPYNAAAMRQDNIGGGLITLGITPEVTHSNLYVVSAIADNSSRTVGAN